MGQKSHPMVTGRNGRRLSDPGHYGVDRYLLPRLGVPWRAKVAATSQS